MYVTCVFECDSCMVAREIRTTYGVMQGVPAGAKEPFSRQPDPLSVLAPTLAAQFGCQPSSMASTDISLHRVSIFLN